MTRQTLTTITVVVLLTAALTGAAVAPAAASHDGGETDTLSDLFTTSDDGFVATTKAVAKGLGERFGYGAASLNPFADKTSAGEYANDTTTVVNQNSGELVQHANQRDVAGWFAHYSDRSNGVDVVEITFTGEDDTTTKRYLVAQYNSTSDQYDSVEMVSDTTHSVDETATLEPRASANAADDIETFLDEYQPSDDVKKSYRRGMAAKYSGAVESPLIPDVGLRDLMGGL